MNIPIVHYVSGIMKNLLSVSETNLERTIRDFHSNCGIIRHQLPNGEILKTSAQNWPPYRLQIMDKTPIEAHAFSISKPHRRCHFTLALWP